MQKKDLKLRKLGLNFSSGKGNQTTLTGSYNGNTSSSIKSSRAEDHIQKPVLNLLPRPPPDRELCPPLPKSQFLSSESGKPKKIDQDNPRLPSPDMEYLTRKPHLPLKWTPSRQWSSHVVDDDYHTVFFIGTRDCEQEIRRTFMATILGEEAVSCVESTESRLASESDYGSVGKVDRTDKDNAVPASKRNFSSDKDDRQAPKRGLILDNATALEREPDAKRSCLADQVSERGESKSSYIAKIGAVIASSPKSPSQGRTGGCGGGREEGGTVGREEGGRRREGGGREVLSTRPSTSALECGPAVKSSSSTAQPPAVCGTNDEDYNTSTDMEILQDPAFLRDFIDDSDSSSDLDLPRVDVTGRYSKGKGKGKAREPSTSMSRLASGLGEASGRRSDIASWAASSFQDAGGSGSAGSDMWGQGSSRLQGGGAAADAGASGSAGSDMWGQGSSRIQGGGVERCPICLTSFPPGRMSSRLRGLKIVASTIIPRVQRLLETEVLKKRPLWLDVVEAYPPLSPPIVPKSSKPSKSFIIEYPVEEGRRSLEESGVSSSARKAATQNQPLSLFERRSVKRIQQWPRESLQGVDLPPRYTAETLDVAKQASEVTTPVSVAATELVSGEQTLSDANHEESLPHSEAPPLATKDATNRESPNTDHEMSPNFEDKIRGLAALLKDYENLNK